jgi:hypothetical protein
VRLTFRNFAWLLRQSIVASSDDGCFAIAKGAAYSALLSFFPVLTSAAAILVQTRADFVARTIQNFLSEILPPGTEDLVAGALPAAVSRVEDTKPVVSTAPSNETTDPARNPTPFTVSEPQFGFSQAAKGVNANLKFSFLRNDGVSYIFGTIILPITISSEFGDQLRARLIQQICWTISTMALRSALASTLILSWLSSI